MQKMIFVNLPVEDLAKATAFYKAIGFTINPTFSNDDASCMVWSDAIFVMLLKHDFYTQFITTRKIVDAYNYNEVLLSLALESKTEVDNLVKKAIESGGKLMPIVELANSDAMYTRDVEDPDGHIWELFYMEMPK